MSFSAAVPNIQIWDNAAFDDNPVGAKPWLPLQPISTNISPFPGKANPSSKKRSTKSFRTAPMDDNLDAEIEEVEKEIRRLSLKLESLRIKKVERDLKAAPLRHGRVVPAKFMEQKPSPVSKKMSDSPSTFRQRSFSLGPSDIQKSIGKSFFQKLEGIKEENNQSKSRPSRPTTKKDSLSSAFRRSGQSKLQELREKKRQSLSVSPRSRKPLISTISELRKGITTISTMKAAKRDDSVLESLKPKNLFQDKEITSTLKKPLKNAKVKIVSSRYSLAAAQSGEPERKRRKWSLPEPDKRSLSLWQALNLSGDEKMKEEGCEPLLSSPTSIMKITTMLPRIKTIRRRSIAESPRDSGCVRRVASLVGSKSQFSNGGASSKYLLDE